MLKPFGKEKFNGPPSLNHLGSIGTGVISFVRSVQLLQTPNVWNDGQVQFPLEEADVTLKVEFNGLTNPAYAAAFISEACREETTNTG